MGFSKSVREIEALLRPVVESLGCELVDVRLTTDRGRRILRLLVDRPGGITLGECADVSREVAPHLDVADPIPGSYMLEVSSPGIQRPLKRAEDFQRFRGERVVVRTSRLIEGRKTFRGTNGGLDAEGRLVIEDREAGRPYTIDLTDVREAHLDPELRF